MLCYICCNRRSNLSDNLIYQVIRVPAQGEWLNVRDKAIEGFKFMDTPGLVSVTLSHPFGTNLTISSQYVFPIDFINQFDGTATTIFFGICLGETSLLLAPLNQISVFEPKNCS